VLIPDQGLTFIDSSSVAASVCFSDVLIKMQTRSIEHMHWIVMGKLYIFPQMQSLVSTGHEEDHVEVLGYLDLNLNSLPTGFV
jgi:hypothetical protein